MDGDDQSEEEESNVPDVPSDEVVDAREGEDFEQTGDSIWDPEYDGDDDGNSNSVGSKLHSMKVEHSRVGRDQRDEL